MLGFTLETTKCTMRVTYRIWGFKRLVLAETYDWRWIGENKIRKRKNQTVTGKRMYR